VYDLGRLSGEIENSSIESEGQRKRLRIQVVVDRSAQMKKRHDLTGRRDQCRIPHPYVSADIFGEAIHSSELDLYVHIISTLNKYPCSEVLRRSRPQSKARLKRLAPFPYRHPAK
jgi:hypothetical protein